MPSTDCDCLPVDIFNNCIIVRTQTNRTNLTHTTILNYLTLRNYVFMIRKIIISRNVHTNRSVSVSLMTSSQHNDRTHYSDLSQMMMIIVTMK